jgi:DNA-binding NarL/FixJ family response regulator
MKDRKYMEAYRMSYASFMYLVSKLEPYLQSTSIHFVRAPLEIRKTVGIVLYRLAHGITAKIIADRFNVGASTVRKYMRIVLDALVSRDKLFGKYISVPSGARLDRL